jgi:hypothetical protein
MARYRVPAEIEAGVYRAGVGHYMPGDELVLPDAASKPDEKPSAKLEPLDEEADAALVKAHPELAKAGKLKRLGDQPKAPKASKGEAKAEAAKAEKAGVDKTPEKHVLK